MHPGTQYDGSPDGDVLRPRSEIGDDDHLAVVASKRLAKYSLADPVLVLNGADPLQIFVAVRVGVWEAVRKENGVIVVPERCLEG